MGKTKALRHCCRRAYLLNELFGATVCDKFEALLRAAFYAGAAAYALFAVDSRVVVLDFDRF